MRTNKCPLWQSICGLMALVLATVGQGIAEEQSAGHRRSQELSLSAGWNAVFLEVEPVDGSPAKVFAGLPVDKVATLLRNPLSNQFVTDPEVDLFKGKGWEVWYAPGLPEAFLKSLDAIHGNRAYLVHAREACQWRVSGGVDAWVPDWQPDAFNLVGFPVRSPGGPTFEQFFAGSKAHRGQPIYRLVAGRWKRVLEPAAETMRSGEAFWIFCEGGSDFQGPLRVETALRRGILLGRSGADVTLRNECPHPLAPTVEHLAGGGPPVPLSILVRAYGNPVAPVTSVAARMPAGEWQQPLPPLEMAGSVAIPLECRSSEMVLPRQGSLLKITTDLGSVSWVPVLGIRDDLDE